MAKKKSNRGRKPKEMSERLSQEGESSKQSSIQSKKEEGNASGIKSGHDIEELKEEGIGSGVKSYSEVLKSAIRAPSKWGDSSEEEVDEEVFRKDGPRTWRSFVKRPQADLSLELEFVSNVSDDEGCIQVSDSEIDEGKSFWKFALVGYIAGGRVSFANISKYVLARWKGIEPPEILSHDSGCFIFKFESEEDLVKILNMPMQFVFGSLFILRRWNPEFDFSAEAVGSIPVWIQLPNLNFKFWSMAVLSKIASYVGKPVRADPNTAARTRVSYARLLVEVNTTSPLVEVVKIRNPDGSVEEQRVKYEWRPIQRSKCTKWGHSMVECKKEMQVEKVENNRQEGKNENVREGKEKGEEKEDGEQQKMKWVEVKKRRNKGVVREADEGKPANDAGRNSDDVRPLDTGQIGKEAEMFIPT